MYVCLFVCMSVCMYACMYMYMCIYIHRRRYYGSYVATVGTPGDHLRCGLFVLPGLGFNPRIAVPAPELQHQPATATSRGARVLAKGLTDKGLEVKVTGPCFKLDPLYRNLNCLHVAVYTRTCTNDDHHFTSVLFPSLFSMWTTSHSCG